MVKKRNTGPNKRVIERGKKVCEMYDSLKAQELRPGVIVEKISKHFFISQNVVYNHLQLRKRAKS